MKAKLLTALCMSISLNLSANDWPQFLGPDRTGKVIDKNFKGSFGKEPKELWKISVGQGFGGASISKNEVFILDRQEDELLCFNKDVNETRAWKVMYLTFLKFKLTFRQSC